MYWPAQPHTAVDLLVEKHGHPLLVQVKTAAWVEKGSYRYLRCHAFTTKKRKWRGKYDLLLAVCGDVVWEIPVALIRGPDITLESTNPNPKYKSREWDKFKRRLRAVEGAQ